MSHYLPRVLSFTIIDHDILSSTIRDIPSVNYIWSILSHNRTLYQVTYSLYDMFCLYCLGLSSFIINCMDYYGLPWSLHECSAFKPTLVKVLDF